MNAKETGLLAPPRSEGERGEPEQSGGATRRRLRPQRRRASRLRVVLRRPTGAASSV